MNLTEFLKTSYTAYHATENAAKLLLESGFVQLHESEHWKLAEGGKYFVVRGGSSLIAFRHHAGPYKIVASHTDSPCLKLKENPALAGSPFTRLNVEPYGGGIWYTFFDRPLRLAGRVVREKNGALCSELYTDEKRIVIPSLAVHMNRGVNESFTPDLQTDLAPLLALGERKSESLFEGAVSYDLFAVPDEEPFYSGIDGEFLSAPRIDNLTSVYYSLRALTQDSCKGACIAACLDSEEIGSRTRQGAGGDFLRAVLDRIALSLGMKGDEQPRAFASSLVVSLDNAHSVHPNRPEKCDPTNRAVIGGGIVIKGHAGGAYTTDALTSALVKKIFGTAGVKFQTFYNRSDMRSGSTLGAISLDHVCVPSVDLGLAQLAMHSAVETVGTADCDELARGLQAIYASKICIEGDTATVE